MQDRRPRRIAPLAGSPWARRIARRYAQVEVKVEVEGKGRLRIAVVCLRHREARRRKDAEKMQDRCACGVRSATSGWRGAGGGKREVRRVRKWLLSLRWDFPDQI